MASSYNVQAGWAIGNGMLYDSTKDEWYLGPTSDNFKAYLSEVTKYVQGGILDPETFTQDNQTACNKFYRGETAILSVNRSQYTSWMANLDENLGAGNYETYQVNADGTKSLMDGYQCGGLGIAGDESDIDIRLQWGGRHH